MKSQSMRMTLHLKTWWTRLQALKLYNLESQRAQKHKSVERLPWSQWKTFKLKIMQATRQFKWTSWMTSRIKGSKLALKWTLWMNLWKKTITLIKKVTRTSKIFSPNQMTGVPDKACNHSGINKKSFLIQAHLTKTLWIKAREQGTHP